MEDIKETFKPIKMERRRKTKIVLKQLIILTLLFVVFTKVFSVHNWMLAIGYSVLSIFVIGFVIMIFRFIKYVKANKGQ